MPRISADSIAEHVAQQEAAVFDAAMRLFLERGYAEVSLGDIAAEVGLARNSLYRYFPHKAHILVRWLRRELPIEAARSRELLAGDAPLPERVDRWARHQLDYARRPEHRLLASLPEAMRQLDDETRLELADIHREVVAPLDDALAGAGFADAPTRAATVDLLFGVVVAAAEHETRLGRGDPVLRRRLRRATDALLVR